MMEKCNLVEFFSGIGSQAKALKNLGVEINTVATSEWDIHAIAAYDLIHTSGRIPDKIQAMDKDSLLNLLEDYTFSKSGKVALEFESLRTYSKESLQRIYTSIIRNKNHVDIRTMKGSQMPAGIDILTYSFPCQDLSNVGAFHGYNKGIDKGSGSRSSLLWQVGRILTEMQYSGTPLPRFLLMENVPTLLSDRHYKNFSKWIDDLDSLGYISKYFLLNASTFGLPQNRPRLLMISVHVGNNLRIRDLIETYFSMIDSEVIAHDYQSSSFFHKYTIQDLLRVNYDNKKIREEAIECTPNDTVSRRKIWDDNPQIVLPGYAFNDDIDTIRTITTKQDRNPNSGNLYFDSGIEGRSKFRYLTPRECLLFMGFTDADYKKLKDNNIEFHKGDSLFTRDKIIRMAGNSIPVKLLEGIFLQILQIDELLNDYRVYLSTNSTVMSHENKIVSIIRSYMFSKGLRSRLNNEPYPDNANIVYPKYKTAIYVRDCFKHGHGCANLEISEINSNILKNIISKNKAEDQQAYECATDLGWNALILWECQLCPDKISETLMWVENIIKNNCNCNNEKGNIIIYDRY